MQRRQQRADRHDGRVERRDEADAVGEVPLHQRRQQDVADAHAGERDRRADREHGERSRVRPHAGGRRASPRARAPSPTRGWPAGEGRARAGRTARSRPAAASRAVRPRCSTRRTRVRISAKIGESAATAVRRLAATSRMPSSAIVRPCQSGRAAGRVSPAIRRARRPTARMRAGLLDVVARSARSAGRCRSTRPCRGCARRTRSRRVVVEVELAVEHVRLDLLVRHAFEGRVVADRDGGRVALAAVGQPAGVDAVGGDEPLGLRRQVRGREAELAAALRRRARRRRARSGCARAGRRRGATSPSASSSRIQVDETRRPCSGRTSSMSSHAKPYVSPSSSQHRDVAGAARAEPEVAADEHDAARAAGRPGCGRTNSSGLRSASARSNASMQRRVHPGAGQQVELLRRC